MTVASHHRPGHHMHPRFEITDGDCDGAATVSMLQRPQPQASSGRIAEHQIRKRGLDFLVESHNNLAGGLLEHGESCGFARVEARMGADGFPTAESQRDDDHRNDHRNRADDGLESAGCGSGTPPSSWPPEHLDHSGGASPSPSRWHRPINQASPVPGSRPRSASGTGSPVVDSYRWICSGRSRAT